MVFSVNCAILQKRNTGFHQTTSCFWDAKRDGKKRFVSRFYLHSESFRECRRSMGKCDHGMHLNNLLRQSANVEECWLVTEKNKFDACRPSDEAGRT